MIWQWKFNKIHSSYRSVCSIYAARKDCSDISFDFDFLVALLCQILYIPDITQRIHILNLRNYQLVSFLKIGILIELSFFNDHFNDLISKRSKNVFSEVDFDIGLLEKESGEFWCWRVWVISMKFLTGDWRM